MLLVLLSITMHILCYLCPYIFLITLEEVFGVNLLYGKSSYDHTAYYNISII